MTAHELRDTYAPLGVQAAKTALDELGALVVIHVDYDHVRVPGGHDLLGIGQAAGRANDKDTVIEGQLDQVHDHLTLVEDKRATGLDSRSPIRRIGHD